MTDTSFKQECEDYFANAIAHGVPVASFNCPCCAEQLKTFAPKKGEAWDSLSTCWHCDSPFVKVIMHNRIEVKTQSESQSQTLNFL